jgi:hypothetical protein
MTAFFYSADEVRAALPRCAVCGKPVDSLTKDEDAFLERVTFTVKCHGDVEKVVFQGAEREALGSPGVDFGEAFAGAKRLRACRGG